MTQTINQQTCKKQKNQSRDTDPEMTEMTELACKCMKTHNKNAPHSQECKGKHRGAKWKVFLFTNSFTEI